MNNHASLTNEFVQQPQAAFTLAEIRLFNASLCCLHRKTASIATTFYIKVKDVASTGSAGYKALAEAIHTLKERRWFNKPLYSVLQQVKNEGVIEVRFNAELQEHLLHADAYYTTINVAALQEAGINHALSLRLLWILRSYYRPLAKVKEKYLTISELEAMLFNGESLGSYRQLKQLVDAAVKHLNRAGIVFTATTKKRGLVAKGIVFTIPAITLKKSAKKTVKERVVEDVKEVAAEVVAVVKEVAVAAPVAAATVFVPAVAEAAKPLTYTNSVNISAASTPQPARAAEAKTLVISGLPASAPRHDVAGLLHALEHKYKLAAWQIKIMDNYLTVAVTQNQLAERFTNVRVLVKDLDLSNAKNDGAFVWLQLKNRFPYLNKIKDSLHPTV